jgi:ferredoxin-NADP reductase
VRLAYLFGSRADRPSWLPGPLADTGDADALRRIAPDIAGAHVYICGPDGWTDAARAAARSAGVDPQRLHIERFAW